MPRTVASTRDTDGVRIAVALALAGLALLGCGARSQDAPAATTSRIAVVVMENKEAGTALDPAQAPYLAGLARRYALATRSYGVTHPSLPNYIALTSGSTQGITSNCTSCHTGARSIVDQLEARGISWKGYMQDMPRPCFRGPGSGDYAKKHNPFMYYDRVVRSPARCAKVVPYTRLGSDLRRGRLPAFSFITPDLCANTHDCSVRTGDRFLSRLVPRLLRGVGPRGFVVVTYDEGASSEGCCTGSRGGRIATVVAGPPVRRGFRLTTPVDHYGVLRTIQDALGLPPLGRARDARSGTLRAMFARAPRVR